MGWHPLPYVVAVIGYRTRSETCQCTSSAGATALCGTNIIAMAQREIFIIKTKDRRARTLQEGQGNYFSCIQVFFPCHGAPWKAFCWDAWWAQAVPVRKLKDCSVFGDGFPQQSEELRSHLRLDSWRSQAELWVVPVTSLSRPASAVRRCPSSRLLHAVTSLLL